MGHIHLKTIEISRSCNHYKRQDKKIDIISSWMLLQLYPKEFPEGNKKWKFTHMARPQQSTLVG